MITNGLRKKAWKRVVPPLSVFEHFTIRRCELPFHFFFFIKAQPPFMIHSSGLHGQFIGKVQLKKGLVDNQCQAVKPFWTIFNVPSVNMSDCGANDPNLPCGKTPRRTCRLAGSSRQKSRCTCEGVCSTPGVHCQESFRKQKYEIRNMLLQFPVILRFIFNGICPRWGLGSPIATQGLFTLLHSL